METLNKNWFGFTLIAVIFGFIGYLVGQLGHSNCPMHDMHMSGGKMHTMMMKNHSAGDGPAKFMFYSDEDIDTEDMNVEVITDTTEDGQIQVRVKKMIKKEK